MGLSHPIALLGLLGLALPLIAHWLRSRSLPERPLPTVALLATATASSRRRARIEDRALLALRLLAMAGLALALAGPTLRLAGSIRPGAEDVALLLDDSLSMETRDGRASRMAGALAEARRELESLHPGSEVSIILAGRPASVLVGEVDPAAALDALSSELRGLERGSALADALRLARRQLARGSHGRQRIWVASDFARHAGADTVPWEEARVPIEFVRTGDSVGRNARVTAVERGPEREGRSTLSVRARGIVRETRVQLVAGDRTLASGTLPAGPAERTVTLSYEPGAVRRAEVRLETQGDPLTADDRFPVWLTTGSDGDLWIVDGAPDAAGRTGESSFLARALEASGSLGAPSHRLVDESALLRLSPDRVRGVVLAGALPTRAGVAALRRFVDGGGGLLIAPSARMRWRAMATRLGDLVPARLGPAREVHGAPRYTESAPATLRSEDLAHVELGRALGLEPRGPDARVWLESDAPLLIEGRQGRGEVILLAVPLADGLGDLPYQPGYLPLVLKVADRLTRHAPTSHPVEAGTAMVVGRSGERLELEQPSGGVRAISGGESFVPEGGIGHYRVRDAAGERPELAFAVVAPTAEGDLTPGEVPPTLGEAAARHIRVARSAALGPWLYLLVGVLVSVEGILRASRRSPLGSRR